MPTYSEMITAAIFGLKQRGRSSRIAIAKYIRENNRNLNPDRFKCSFRLALKRGVEKGIFIQKKQSFKLSGEQKKVACLRRTKGEVSKKSSGGKSGKEINNTRPYMLGKWPWKWTELATLVQT